MQKLAGLRQANAVGLTRAQVSFAAVNSRCRPPWPGALLLSSCKATQHQPRRIVIPHLKGQGGCEPFPPHGLPDPRPGPSWTKPYSAPPRGGSGISSIILIDVIRSVHLPEKGGQKIHSGLLRMSDRFEPCPPFRAQKRSLLRHRIGLGLGGGFDLQIRAAYLADQIHADHPLELFPAMAKGRTLTQRQRGRN
jgi:hypothetical protein